MGAAQRLFRGILIMADLMWGGVPFTIPSKTAMKYLSGAVKVKRECNLPAGGHYNSRKTLDREFVGHRESRKKCWRVTKTMKDKKDDSEVSQDNGQIQVSEFHDLPLVTSMFPMDPVHYHAKSCSFGPSLTRCPLFRSNKPGAGIGWTEPRMESYLGMVDRRKRLPGYVGGVKLRDSIFGNESRI